MHCRMIDLDIDYPVLAGWWEARGLVAPQKVVLEGAHGIAVVADSRDLCAGWIYVGNKGVVGMVEWAIGNPAVTDARLMRAALGLLYDFLEQFAKSAGCVVLFTSTAKESSLAKLIDGRKWQICPGEPHAHYVKEVA